MKDVTLDYLKKSYQNDIEDVLDDPHGIWDLDRPLSSWVSEMTEIGSDIGMDFWVIAQENSSEFEMNRFKEMLKAEEEHVPGS